MQIAGIIAAAGKSERFAPGTEKKKLEQELGDRPVFMRSLETLSNRPEVVGIIVATNPDTFAEFKLRHGDALGIRGAKVVPGGKVARWETIKNALDAIPENATHVAIHDGARPCITDELLDRLFEAAKMFDAVVPGIPVSSTLKRISEESETAATDDAVASAILGDAGATKTKAHQVLETVSRENLYEIQTPQVYSVELIRRAYAQDDLESTDDAMLVERLGETVRVVEGDPFNIKITTEADLHLARKILGVRPPKQRATHLRF